MNIELRNAFNQVADLGETMDGSGVGCLALGFPLATANQLRIDFVRCCCDVTQIDGKISQLELRFLAEYFDYYATDLDIKELTPKGQTIENSDYIPLSFKAFVYADKTVANAVEGSEMKCCGVYCNVLASLCSELITISGDTSPKAIKTVSDFFNRLRKYALNNGVQVDGDILMLGSGNDTRLAREEKVEDDTGSVSDDSADKDTLASLLQVLNSLIGLESVKDDLRSLINLVKI